MAKKIEVKKEVVSSPMKVKAKAMGYYGGEIKDVGRVFMIKGPQEFSKVWMTDLSGSKAVAEEPAEENDSIEADEGSENLI